MSIRASWLGVRETSWSRSLLLSPLLPISWLYGGAAALHRALYQHGLLARRRLAGQVVCVGNLVVGGTAKTPLAAWLASGLHRRGRKVALASRGYGEDRPLCKETTTKCRTKNDRVAFVITQRRQSHAVTIPFATNSSCSPRSVAASMEALISKRCAT